MRKLLFLPKGVEYNLPHPCGTAEPEDRRQAERNSTEAEQTRERQSRGVDGHTPPLSSTGMRRPLTLTH